MQQNAQRGSRILLAVNPKDYAMRTIIEHMLMDTKDIKFNAEYQRTLEQWRLKKIIASMRAYGYWPSEVIVLNEKHEVVDGQHRTKAAINIGIKQVPVCIVTFPNKKLEAKFFADKSNYNCNLKPVDFWHARYLSGHPVAEALYKLEADKSCNLYNRVALKGRESKTTKYIINQVLSMFCMITRMNDSNWRKDNDDQLMNKILEISYDKLVAKINQFTTWLEQSFGLKGGSMAYETSHFRSILKFYSIIEDHGDAQKSESIKKMRSYIFTSELSKLTHTARVYALIAHYNKGKMDKNKISYEPIEKEEKA
jgi:hypothetical protein